MQLQTCAVCTDVCSAHRRVQCTQTCAVHRRVQCIYRRVQCIPSIGVWSQFLKHVCGLHTHDFFCIFFVQLVVRNLVGCVSLRNYGLFIYLPDVVYNNKFQVNFPRSSTIMLLVRILVGTIQNMVYHTCETCHLIADKLRCFVRRDAIKREQYTN